MKTNDILDFFFEIGHLRRIKHEGWRLIGVDAPDSVAEHTLRAAQIGFVLAKLEGYANPYEVCTMVVFHDNGEARVGDVHKIANRYTDVDEARAVREQLARLEGIGVEILDLWQQTEDRSTTAGIIAKDADLLEQAVMAREHIERGHAAAQEWIDSIARMVQTTSAKQLIAALPEVGVYDWWRGLKKLTK